jgi:AcrR family transcriptional regulator
VSATNDDQICVPDEHGERKGQRTQRRILDAARGVFADVGYELATVRGIAAAAGVDKSSVLQYFGTKQNLFREAVAWTVPTEDGTYDDPGDAAEALARRMLATWAADPNSPIAVLLRTSMTSEEAAALLREHITAATGSVAEMIDAPDARLRIAVLGAMLMGIASQRYLVGMPDLEVDTEDILKLIGPLIRQLVDPSTGCEL